MTQAPSQDPRALEDEIGARIGFFERPPEGFNPLIARSDELERYGIPPRPDPQTRPALARFWTEMFSPPLEFVPVQYALATEPLLISAPPRVTAGQAREASLNWCGAYITPRDGRQLTEVHGSWTVPGVAAPTGMPATDEYRSSIWIGLDGQRRYLDSSLPQIGTAQFLNAGILPPFSTWWQWWLRDHTLPPVTLGLAVAPGERVMCSLLVLNDTCVKFIIENRTTGEIFTPCTMLSPTDLATGSQVLVSGATAEWIVERPTRLATGELHELPDYGAVAFTDCLAVSAKLQPGLPPGPDCDETLEGTRLRRMYKAEQNPSRTVTIS